MFQLTFTQNNTIHKGFRRWLASDNAGIGNNLRLVVAWFDGEPDLWVVEDREGFQELMRYYAKDWGPDRVKYQQFTAIPR